MPFFHIRTINVALMRGTIARTVPTWRCKKAGVHAGGRIALSELSNGIGSMIIEVRLEQTDGKLVDRFAVTSSDSDLKTL